MAYKDKDKQREADRARQKRRRDKIKAESVTESRRDGESVTVKLPEHSPSEVAILERDMICGKPERTVQGNIRVSKPSDPDYVPQCETTRAFIEGRDKRPSTAKRGKDIKVFADLPLDVQETIDKMSLVDGKIDQTIKANRTAIAINYQHLFPWRYYSTGVV